MCIRDRHGADPNLAEEQPLLLTAVRCCGPEVVALFAGQAAKFSPKQKERAFQEVRWGQRAENIPVLEQAGITVDKFGGEAFRAACLLYTSTTSAGGCGVSLAAFSCPASACPSDRVSRGFFIV